jgi:general secretion pathway protein G
MMRIRNQKGFTLLEIMLVVLIIGIIALLALPRLLVTRRIAQEQVCLGDQSAIRTHLEAYKWDWGTYPDTDVSSSVLNPINGNAAAPFAAGFLNDPLYWPAGDPAPKLCPIGGAGDAWLYSVTTATSPQGYLFADEYLLLCPNGHEQASSL